MRKLESLNDKKFDVTTDELLQVKGGYTGLGPTALNTYDTTMSDNSDGTKSSDKDYSDSCVDN